MYSAVVECYESLKDIIYNLLQHEEDKMSSMYCDRIVSHICVKVEWSIQEHTFVKEFKMSGLPSLIMENLRLNTKKRGQRFVNIDTDFTVNKSVKEKVIRLHLLLTVKESAINVPQNLDARRHITFFANSLFMNMPKAPKVRNVLSFRSFAASKLNDLRWDSDFEKLWKPPPNPSFLPCTKLTPNYTTKHIRLLFGQCETVPEPGNNPTSGKNGSFLGLLSAVRQKQVLIPFTLTFHKQGKARVVDDTNPEEIEITTPAFNEANFERVERLIKGCA
ncbi:hypothetical protein Ahy_A01g003234 [Arachis hypogaea]|uniref:Callose synthase helical domain-containing protein n=1 Tax=Arachis hypogaea TaxID=3818 RepID=A0A445ESG5_ARAHY|nr:hypothetical protein Ahy_A01g003234 [Arachis hypogaea]